MKTSTIKTMLRNMGCYLSAICLLIIASCNVEVKSGDADDIDSNVKSGVVKIMNEVDSVNKENAKELLKSADTEVQRLNRVADSTRGVLRNKKKELQKQVEQ